MPTILEHLAALFDKDMRAVLNNPRAISMIANPSARVQMAAVRRDKSVICFIERPTEKVQLKAVEKRPECIFLLQKPAEKVQLTAVLKDPRYLSAIREPTEKVQLAAVQKNPECIRHIAEPTEKVQHMAVQRSPDIFRQIRQPEESVRLAAVQAKGENIRYVPAPSETVQLAAVRNDPMNIRYIENPTEKVQSVVLNADRDAAPFISSPTEEIKRLAMEMYGLRLENAAGKQTAAARTSETSGASGKKALEGVAKKPSAKQVREAVEKLDSEIREINREYFQATYEAQYSDNPAERESEVSAAGKNREKKLVKAYEKFNSAAVPERKECNVGKIVKELRKERVAVENMKAGEWHSLMKGKAVHPPLVSGASKAAGKGSALMLARTPAGYALKAAGAINQAGRQANAEM
ncbi:hypothetical protein [Phocaeicola dorei]|uniref:hypothetical protein n=1 Tax=Phocaeicola dorei TaxID=357276 RepID=UPI00192144B3|nr:hypothetical protein [Phocaeicola dorei]